VIVVPYKKDVPIDFPKQCHAAFNEAAKNERIVIMMKIVTLRTGS